MPRVAAASFVWQESELPEYLRKRLEDERKQRLAAGLPDGSAIRESEVTVKDREAWDRVQTKRRKAENLHEEAGRIQRKREQQGGDLTEGVCGPGAAGGGNASPYPSPTPPLNCCTGQENRLSQIERHIEKLTEEIREAEDGIRAKFAPARLRPPAPRALTQPLAAAGTTSGLRRRGNRRRARGGGRGW